jgi:hypothetical protein
MTRDMINHPAHYLAGRKFEPIDVIEDWGLGYHLGTVLKYVARAGRKDDLVQDLKKCQWYLNRFIEKIGGSEASTPVEQEEREDYADLVETMTELKKWLDTKAKNVSLSAGQRTLLNELRGILQQEEIQAIRQLVGTAPWLAGLAKLEEPERDLVDVFDVADSRRAAGGM